LDLNLDLTNKHHKPSNSFWVAFLSWLL